MTKTSAPETDFVSVQLASGKRTLYLDGNQKISGWKPVPNAFSILQVTDCPYATPTCKLSCYVHNLEKHQPAIHALYRHNSKEIRDVLKHSGQADWWADAFAHYITGRVKSFRWHVSGDVFSEDYANFIVAVCDRTNPIPHWIYTRSFPFVPILVKAENLRVNISADKDNYLEAKRVAEDYGLSLCYLSDDGYVPVDADVIFPDYSLRGLEGKSPSQQRSGSTWWNSLSSKQQGAVCPVDFYGKSYRNRCGPCKKCL